MDNYAVYLFIIAQDWFQKGSKRANTAKKHVFAHMRFVLSSAARLGHLASQENFKLAMEAPKTAPRSPIQELSQEGSLGYEYTQFSNVWLLSNVPNNAPTTIQTQVQKLIPKISPLII